MHLPPIKIFQDVQKDVSQPFRQLLIFSDHSVYFSLHIFFSTFEFHPTYRAFFLHLLYYVNLSALIAKLMLGYKKNTEQGSIIDGALSQQIQQDKSSSGSISDGVRIVVGWFFF